MEARGRAGPGGGTRGLPVVTSWRMPLTKIRAFLTGLPNLSITTPLMPRCTWAGSDGGSRSPGSPGSGRQPRQHPGAWGLWPPLCPPCCVARRSPPPGKRGDRNPPCALPPVGDPAVPCGPPPPPALGTGELPSTRHTAPTPCGWRTGPRTAQDAAHTALHVNWSQPGPCPCAVHRHHPGLPAWGPRTSPGPCPHCGKGE